MLEIFFVVLSFAIGRWQGIEQASYRVNKEQDDFKSSWLEAEEKAETWKRRYNNLASSTQSSLKG